MRNMTLAASIGAVIATVLIGAAAAQQWTIHDRNRLHPPVITPGHASTQAQPGRPPSDAIVLFNGKDLSGWEQLSGGPATWKDGDCYFVIAPNTVNLRTQ